MIPNTAGILYGTIMVGAAELPGRTTLAQFYGAAILTGIGFTMSLFIGGLAFDDPLLAVQVKVGVLGGSLVAGCLGALLLSRARARGGVAT